jgi:two-component system alkaline phosphatase synthesis response regulator PhoP
MAKKILLVDDDYDFTVSVKTVLEASGFQVVTASSGEEGLEKVGAERPDLIVLDVMMPGMNGWEVCETLKDSEDTRKIPVIMLTAVASHVKDTSFSHASGRQTEAEDYIPKPVEPERLLRSVRSLLP